MLESRYSFAATLPPGRGHFDGQESRKEDVEKSRKEDREEGGTAEAAQDRAIRQPLVRLSLHRSLDSARDRAGC